MLIEATTQTTLGNVYILVGSEDLHVGAAVTLRSTYTDAATGTGADAILSWSGTHKITVDGTVYGADEAINLVGCVTAQSVIVNATGRLFGGGDGVVQDADGVILDGLGSSLRNLGVIAAYGSAISAIVPEGGTTTLVNIGSMSGRVAGVWHKFGLGSLTLTNSGTLESVGTAYLGNDGVDRVTNSGTIIGNIVLDGGADCYFGTTGTVLGQIDGGDGDDVFRPGSHGETLIGGAGIDQLDLTEATGAITLNLGHPGQNAGTLVAGDSLSGFENVLGGGFSDRITGDAGANRLEGAGRLDTLSGGAGDDTLIGGRGDDRCIGGLGADQFLFENLKQIGDHILDFTSGSDRIAVDATAFGLGAGSGVLDAAAFVLGTAARDADDRFVFDAASHRLWFDADGSGSKAAVVLAWLQVGATLGASDIILL